MTVVATGKEGSTGARPLASGTSVDEVQDLIRRTEEILDTLKELGDTSYGRLRQKLNENVNVVRDKLMDRVERAENGSDAGGHSAMRCNCDHAQCRDAHWLCDWTSSRTPLRL